MAEAADLESGEHEGRSYGWLGNKLNRRLPLREPFEQKLKAHMVQLKKKIMKKIQRYEEEENNVKLRKYQRELWSIIGMLDENFEFQTVLAVHDLFAKIDMVPVGYNYPEFYEY